MNNFCTGAKFTHRVGYAVIKTRPHRKNHIAVVHRHIGFVKAMHPQHAKELSVRGWVGTQAHQRIRNGVIQLFRQLR